MVIKKVFQYKDPFENWKADQEIYKTVSIKDVGPSLETRNVTKLTRKLTRFISDLQTYAGFFDQAKVSECLADYKIPGNKKFRAAFNQIYLLLEDDMSGFIDYLVKNHCGTEILNKVEKRQHVNVVVKKYSDLFDLLFDMGDEDEKDELLFTVANKFFEYCFYPKTFPHFKTLLQDSESHPILRLLYSIMWSNLAEVGWQHWHADCLKHLKTDASAGKEILYIAGGTDIYQLLKNGMYNIRVIDPMLPSQPKFYSEGWEWFIKGKGNGVGETVEFTCGDKNLLMERYSFKKTGEQMKMKLSNDEKVIIPESTTVWRLYDKDKKKLGEVTFERRLVAQDDFKMKKNKSMLISFNELYFSCATKDRDGWGINPEKFDDSFSIHVKQLKNPVDKKICCNYRSEIKQTDFAFIELGSCVD